MGRDPVGDPFLSSAADMFEIGGGEEFSRPGCDCPPRAGPLFACTVGLFGLWYPELLIFGAPPETAASVLNDLGERVRAGQALLPDQLIRFRDWPHRIIPESVPHAGDIVFSANDFCRRPDKHSVRALQLTYDDTEGQFPWDDGYAAPEMQPPARHVQHWPGAHALRRLAGAGTQSHWPVRASTIGTHHSGSRTT